MYTLENWVVAHVFWKEDFGMNHLGAFRLKENRASSKNGIGGLFFHDSIFWDLTKNLVCIFNIFILFIGYS